MTKHARHYTLEQANAVLDGVRERIERRAARIQLSDEDARTALGEAAPSNGGGQPGRVVSEAFLELQRSLGELQAMDVVLRDLERGGGSTSPPSATTARSTSAGSPARTRSGSGTTWTPAMADAGHSRRPRRAALGVAATVRRLNFEQRVAAVGALLLVVSTFGPFSFVEAAEVLIGVSVLFLLRRRAEGREFHFPFGDGGVIAAAGAWSAVLILTRVFAGRSARRCSRSCARRCCCRRRGGASQAAARRPPGADAAAHQRDWGSVEPDNVATDRLPNEPRRRRRRTARRVEDEETAVRERHPAAREPSREQLFDPERHNRRVALGARLADRAAAAAGVQAAAARRAPRGPAPAARPRSAARRAAAAPSRAAARRDLAQQRPAGAREATLRAVADAHESAQPGRVLAGDRPEARAHAHVRVAPAPAQQAERAGARPERRHTQREAQAAPARRGGRGDVGARARHR